MFSRATHTFVSPSADSRKTVASYWRKCVYEVLVNFLGGLSLPRKKLVRLTDRPDMTLDVYRGRKTTTQQQQQKSNFFVIKTTAKKVCQTFFYLKGSTFLSQKKSRFFVKITLA